MEAVSTSRRTKAVNRRLVTTKESALRPLPVSLPAFFTLLGDQLKRSKSELLCIHCAVSQLSLIPTQTCSLNSQNITAKEAC